jgi:hypothetical protein
MDGGNNAGSLKWTLQPSEKDYGKMPSIGQRRSKYLNQTQQRRLFMQSGAKPQEQWPRVTTEAEARHYNSRAGNSDAIAAVLK